MPACPSPHLTWLVVATERRLLRSEIIGEQRILTSKAFADVLRRPVRTLLVVLGILVGVFGLTAINVANATVYSALAYTASQTNIANVTYTTRGVDASILPALASIAHVSTVQVASSYQTRWQTSGASGHANLTITAYPDEQHIALDAFQVTSGTLPGPGEIVMDFADNSYSHVRVGDTVTVDTPDGPKRLRVSGISRTLGSETAGISGHAIGYMSVDGLDSLAHLSQPNTVQVAFDTANRSAQYTAIGALYRALQARGVTVLGYNFDPQPLGVGPLPGIFAIMCASRSWPCC